MTPSFAKHVFFSIQQAECQSLIMSTNLVTQ